MLPQEPRSEAALRGLGITLVGVAFLALGGPALAGETGGNLLPGSLLLELDATDSQFRLIDCVDVDLLGNGNECDDTLATPNTLGTQVIWDRKLTKAKDSCLAALDPPEDNPAGMNGNLPSPLVSFPGAPAFTNWGTDEGKFALGGKEGNKKGAGCGQLEFGEILRLEFNLGFLTDFRIQVEAKQDASVRVILISDDGINPPQEVGRRYLLSGRAPLNPPAEIAAVLAGPNPEHVTTILGRSDGGPDSGNNDDGFWISGLFFGDDPTPAHNVEVFEIRENSNGVRGKISFKGGGEFIDPFNNRAV